MRFVVGSDHAAVELREALVERLRAWGHEVVGVLGPARSDERTDYPDVAHEVARQVSAEPDLWGLLLCGSGQGMAMTANRHPDVRAVVCSEPYSAAMGRAHNDANVLCLGARVVGPGLAETILRAFVEGRFEGGRHGRRVAKIDAGAR
ncbi:MAG: ribose 5-phosphate isomerase B [Deltaproteobacteria bacterium]|nr:MAG: ribose 5-phosphate isomerase B [Deltaproteobacteria bacterium]